MRPSFSDCCNTSPAIHKWKEQNCSLRIALLAQHFYFANAGGYLKSLGERETIALV